MENFGLLSLLPPLVAIVLCIVTKQLVVSLFIGAFTGAMVLVGGNPIIAFVTTMSYMVKTVASEWNASILVFTVALGGFIGLLGKSGGMQGLRKPVGALVQFAIGQSLAGGRMDRGELVGPGSCVGSGIHRRLRLTPRW